MRGGPAAGRRHSQTLDTAEAQSGWRKRAAGPQQGARGSGRRTGRAASAPDGLTSSRSFICRKMPFLRYVFDLQGTRIIHINTRARVSSALGPRVRARGGRGAAVGPTLRSIAPERLWRHLLHVLPQPHHGNRLPVGREPLGKVLAHHLGRCQKSRRHGEARQGVTVRLNGARAGCWAQRRQLVAHLTVRTALHARWRAWQCWRPRLALTSAHCAWHRASSLTCRHE